MANSYDHIDAQIDQCLKLLDRFHKYVVKKKNWTPKDKRLASQALAKYNKELKKLKS